MAPPQICFAEFAKEEKDLQANPRIAARVRAVKGISPSAEGDQRPTALEPCRLLKKAGENFQQTDERPCFGQQFTPAGTANFAAPAGDSMFFYLLMMVTPVGTIPV